MSPLKPSVVRRYCTTTGEAGGKRRQSGIRAWTSSRRWRRSRLLDETEQVRSSEAAPTSTSGRTVIVLARRIAQTRKCFTTDKTSASCSPFMNAVPSCAAIELRHRKSGSHRDSPRRELRATVDVEHGRESVLTPATDNAVPTRRAIAVI